MLFPANIAPEQGVIVVVIVIALFIFTRLRYTVHQHTFNRSRLATLLQDSGNQTFLSESHISSCTNVRGPDILPMFLDMLQCSKSQIFCKHLCIIHKMSLQLDERVSRAGCGRGP